MMKITARAIHKSQTSWQYWKLFCLINHQYSTSSVGGLAPTQMLMLKEETAVFSATCCYCNCQDTESGVQIKHCFIQGNKKQGEEMEMSRT